METKQDILFKNNFFMTDIIASEYNKAKTALIKASQPPKKKVYRNMDKMLQECFLVGSLKYGNNFIG